jgi:hypothetical protein
MPMIEARCGLVMELMREPVVAASARAFVAAVLLRGPEARGLKHAFQRCPTS